jgi:hypothetical protein
MSIGALAIVVTIVLAFCGYIVTFALQRIQANREAQLARINLQLRNLYGPLYSTLKANQEIWDKFAKKLWPKHGEEEYFGDGLTQQKRRRSAGVYGCSKSLSH